MQVMDISNSIIRNTRARTGMSALVCHLNSFMHFEVSGRRMKLLLATLLALIAADGVITNFLVGNNLASELNPLMQGLVGGNGLILVKAVGAMLGIAVLWHLYKRRPQLAMNSCLIFVVLYTGIVYWNVAMFLVATV